MPTPQNPFTIKPLTSTNTNTMTQTSKTVSKFQKLLLPCFGLVILILVLVAVLTVGKVDAKEQAISKIRQEQVQLDLQLSTIKEMYLKLDAGRSKIEAEMKEVESKGSEIRNARNANSTSISSRLCMGR